MPHITFTHDQLLNLQWLVDAHKDELVPGDGADLLFKIRVMLKEDGQELRICRCPGFRG